MLFNLFGLGKLKVTLSAKRAHARKRAIYDAIERTRICPECGSTHTANPDMLKYRRPISKNKVYGECYACDAEWTVRY